MKRSGRRFIREFYATNPTIDEPQYFGDEVQTFSEAKRVTKMSGFKLRKLVTDARIKQLLQRVKTVP